MKNQYGLHRERCKVCTRSILCPKGRRLFRVAAKRGLDRFRALMKRFR
jgi:hypothetical protein